MRGKAQLNFGVIGLGRMGSLYARTVATQVAAAKLYAVAEVSYELRDAVAGQWAVPHVYADYRELLANRDVDAVIIATPTSTHAELVIATAEAGKAIFCEKPIALSLEQTDAALAAVAQANVPLQVGFMRRFDAAYAKAKAMIDAGQIGIPTTFKAVGRDPFCPNPLYADPKLSGGLITDMAIHDFDLARWLMNSEVERVSTEGTLLVCDTLRAVGDIDNALVNLRFQSGAIGNVEVSRNAFYGYDIRTEVLGSEGAINIGQYQYTPLLLLTRSGGQHDVTPYLMERFGVAYAAQILSFAEAVRLGQPPVVGGADGRASLEIALAATRALHEGRSVRVAELANGLGSTDKRKQRSIMQQYNADNLIIHPGTVADADVIVEVMPAAAGWEQINFQVRRLHQGQGWDFETGENELVLLPLGGQLTVTSDKGNWPQVGRRKDVFSGKPHALYLPRRTSFHLNAVNDAEFALAWTATDRDNEAVLVTPAQVGSEVRGGDNVTRHINNPIPPGFAAHKLVLVEVYTPGGNWSSYPPHKHDVHTVSPDGKLLEADLEELYYYKIDPPNGFALQRIYTDAASPLHRAGYPIDAALVVRNNDVVLVPEGYHPVTSAPGYLSYYLNVLAGSAQSLANTEDPAHAWVKGTYKGTDVRVPVY